jgi:hypothetical protein
MIYLQGARMTHQIGANLTALGAKLRRVEAFQSEARTVEGTNIWEDPQAQFRYEYLNEHRPWDNWAR